MIFFLFLDTTVVNIFIIYLIKCKKRSQEPINHLQFMVELYEAFVHQWDLEETLGLLGLEVFVILYSWNYGSLVWYTTALEWFL